MVSIEKSRVLDLDEEYKSFPEFYVKNKRKIYKKTLDIFKEVSETDNYSLFLSIKVVIEGKPFENSIEYGRNNKELLLQLFLPYFKELEEYEICADIIKIDKSLSRVLKN